ncbi:MAG TPA: cytochrome c [Methylomirabilota bacterium]|nr:cytochrome c [Methylomirabilota bacterium]
MWPTLWGSLAVLAVVALVVVESSWAQDRAALVARGRALVTDQRCLDCHTVGVVGTPIGPDLARAAGKYREADLARWLRDPAAQAPTRHMPALGLSEAEAQALAAYLASLGR